MAIKHSLFRGLSLGFASLGVALIIISFNVSSTMTKRTLGVVSVLSLIVSFIVAGIWKYQTLLLASKYDIRSIEDERDKDMAEYIKYVFWTEIMWTITSVVFILVLAILILKIFKK
jgi:hypothetical protein